MDSINPWLDVEELNRLAQQLIDSPLPSRQNGEKTTPQLRAGRALADASQRAKSAGIMSPSPSSVVRSQALPAIASWIQQHSESKGFCVLDRDGDIVHDELASDAWKNWLVMVAREGMHLEGDRPASIRIRVNGEDYLQSVAVETVRGMLLVGRIGAEVLAGEKLVKFAAAVKLAAG